jgi:hypothetical protein
MFRPLSKKKKKKPFKAYLKKIMQIFFDDFSVYGNKNLGHDLPCEEIQTLFINNQLPNVK